jgi:hypothetical protein
MRSDGRAANAPGGDARACRTRARPVDRGGGARRARPRRGVPPARRPRRVRERRHGSLRRSGARRCRRRDRRRTVLGRLSADRGGRNSNGSLRAAGEGAHAEVEWVDLASLVRCRDVYIAVARSVAG